MLHAINSITPLLGSLITCIYELKYSAYLFSNSSTYVRTLYVYMYVCM